MDGACFLSHGWLVDVFRDGLLQTSNGYQTISQCCVFDPTHSLIGGGMVTAAGKPVFADESLLCLATTRNKVLGSSRQVGWSSLLIDHFEVSGDSGAIEKPATPDICISICLSGRFSLAVRNAGKWKEAKQGTRSVGIIQSGEALRMRAQAARAQAFALSHIYLPNLVYLQALDHFHKPGLRPHIASLPSLQLDNGVIESTALSLLQAARAETSDLYAEQAALWLASHLACTGIGLYGPGSDTRKPGLISDLRLAKVTEFMTVNFGRQLTVVELAREAGISPFHFSRLFKLASGSTPHKYLTGLRMVKARELLCTTEMSISEIASRCGYLTSSAFAAAFTHHFGSSPRSMRLPG